MKNKQERIWFIYSYFYYIWNWTEKQGERTKIKRRIEKPVDVCHGVRRTCVYLEIYRCCCCCSIKSEFPSIIISHQTNIWGKISQKYLGKSWKWYIYNNIFAWNTHIFPFISLCADAKSRTVKRKTNDDTAICQLHKLYSVYEPLFMAAFIFIFFLILLSRFISCASALFFIY